MHTWKSAVSVIGVFIVRCFPLYGLSQLWKQSLVDGHLHLLLLFWYYEQCCTDSSPIHIIWHILNYYLKIKLPSIIEQLGQKDTHFKAFNKYFQIISYKFAPMSTATISIWYGTLYIISYYYYYVTIISQVKIWYLFAVYVHIFNY